MLTSDAELRAAFERLRGAPRVGFDTEGASFHRYVDRIYLMQLSTDDVTLLIDPLGIGDLTPVGLLLADPATEMVIHDADYDLRTLDRDYGFRVRRLFDTRVAAQLAGEEAVGLGALLEKYVGVRLDKKHQRADWSVRPLPAELIAYAADDTRYLLELRDNLEQRLRELGRLSWAEEEFRLLEAVRWTGVTAGDNDAFLRLKGAKALRGHTLAVLKKLYEWRDAAARRLDRAPFRVLGNDHLLAIAKAQPRDMAALLAVPGLPAKLARRHGAELLGAVRAGLALPADQVPRVARSSRPERHDDYEMRVQRLKALRNRRAEDLGLDAGTVCPNNTLQAIALAAPRTEAALDSIDGLRRWQREVLGDPAILEAVSG